jgi:tRNA U38,U39,U40 pseudouridine synthase TruA
MVGALVAVGAGQTTPDQVETLLESGDRQHAPPVAPAAGLTLVSVEYE